MIPLIIQLGSTDSSDVQRHVVRAIDNLLNLEVDMKTYLRDAGAGELLKNLLASKMNDDIRKRITSALKRLESPDENSLQINAFDHSSSSLDEQPYSPRTQNEEPELQLEHLQLSRSEVFFFFSLL